MLSINKDINYGPLGSPTSRHGVDCYWYNTAPASQKPCVVFVHGGGWVSGDKNTYRDDCLRVSQEHGINAFTINYKLGPSSYPDNLNDIRLFIEWLKAAPCCNSKVLFIGFSAGGHLSCLNALIDKSVRAILNVSGPWDLIPGGPNPPALIAAADAMRGTAPALEVSPVVYTVGATVPIWDLRAEDDTMVTDSLSFDLPNLPIDSRQILGVGQHTLVNNPDLLQQTIDWFLGTYATE